MCLMKKRSKCPILSLVRIGKVDVILPVYMILDSDMAFIALIPNGILLAGRVGYTGITFQRLSPLHMVVIISSSCIIWQNGSSRKLSVINKKTYVDLSTKRSTCRRSPPKPWEGFNWHIFGYCGSSLVSVIRRMKSLKQCAPSVSRAQCTNSASNCPSLNQSG